MSEKFNVSGGNGVPLPKPQIKRVVKGTTIEKPGLKTAVITGGEQAKGYKPDSSQKTFIEKTVVYERICTCNSVTYKICTCQAVKMRSTTKPLPNPPKAAPTPKPSCPCHVNCTCNQVCTCNPQKVCTCNRQTNCSCNKVCSCVPVH